MSDQQKQIDYGGAAFPMPSGPEPRVDSSTHYNEGMSLRDYFAAKAMQGFCANPAIFAADMSYGWKLVNATEENLIEYAFHLSDIAIVASKEAKP